MSAIRQKISPEIRMRLSQSADYRDFLQTYFKATQLSYAEVARRGGFSSRSYPRDVTEGRRRLTVRSLPSLIRGLRLESGLVKVFQMLYYAAYPVEHPESLSSEAIHERLERDRIKVARSGVSASRKRERLPKLSGTRGRNPTALATGLLDLMAALGEIGEGATLEEIQKRTGLRRSILQEQLKALDAVGGVTYAPDTKRFTASAEHVDWTGFGGADLAKLACDSAIERMTRVAATHFASDETLFVNSAFAVAKQDLPRLKVELRELLLKFVDHSIEEATSTDTIVHVVSSLFEGRLAPPD